MRLGLRISEAVKICPELRKYVEGGKIDFSNRVARILYNKAICKALFGLNVEYHKKGLVTPPISRYIFLKTFLRGGEKVLEIGTGHTALMALLAEKLFRCEVWATEICEEFYFFAKKNLERNNSKIKLILSKGGIIKGVVPKGERFDVIFSAPPYYPKPPKGVLTKVEAVGGGKYGEEFSKNLLAEGIERLNESGKIALFMRDDKNLLEEVISFGRSLGFSCKDLEFRVGTRVRHSLIFSI